MVITMGSVHTTIMLSVAMAHFIDDGTFHGTRELDVDGEIFVEGELLGVGRSLNECLGVGEGESAVDVAGESVGDDWLDNFASREQAWAFGPLADDVTFGIDQVEVRVDEACFGVIDEALFFEADFVGVVHIIGIE